jgi:hypothetical protein
VGGGSFSFTTHVTYWYEKVCNVVMRNDLSFIVIVLTERYNSNTKADDQRQRFSLGALISPFRIC